MDKELKILLVETLLWIVFLAGFLLCEGCTNNTDPIVNGEKDYQITFTVTLLPEDSAATVEDLQQFVEYYLEIHSLAASNYFFELGMQELNARNVTVKPAVK